MAKIPNEYTFAKNFQNSRIKVHYSTYRLMFLPEFYAELSRYNEQLYCARYKQGLAVAEMDDRLATIDMDRKLRGRGLCPFGEAAVGLASNTM